MPAGTRSLAAGMLLIATAVSVAAEEAPAPGTSGRARVATVIGIANGDLLNIRAAASATGMTIARVPNGALLKVAGCDVVAGNLWCRVEDAADPSARGWTPARYLNGYEAHSSEAATAPAAPSPDADTIMSDQATFDAATGNPKKDPRQRAVVASFYIEPLPSADGDASSAQLRREAGAPEPEEAVARPSSPSELGAPGRAVAAFIALPAIPRDDEEFVFMTPPAEPASAPRKSDSSEIAAGQAPVSETPKPADLPAQTLATAASGLSGELPCARHAGQAMTMCSANVVREGAGNAVVTVTWPDGATRVLRFRDGLMQGSDSPEPFQAGHEASLHMIRIGKAERFEITDAFAFGE